MDYNKFASFHHAKIGLTVMGIVLAAGILVFLVVLPQISALTGIKSEIDNNERQIAQIQSEVKSYQEAHATFRKITGNDAVPQIFPVREDMVGLIKDLEKSVILSGGSHILMLTDLEKDSPSGIAVKQPEPVIAGLAKVQEIPYTIQYRGNYRQTLNFLLYLENLPKLTYLTELSFNAESVKKEGEAGSANTGFAFSQIDGLLFVKRKP